MRRFDFDLLKMISNTAELSSIISRMEMRLDEYKVKNAGMKEEHQRTQEIIDNLRNYLLWSRTVWEQAYQAEKGNMRLTNINLQLLAKIKDLETENAKLKKVIEA